MSAGLAVRGGMLDSYAAMHPEQFANAVARGQRDSARELLTSLSDEVLPGVLVCLPQPMAGEILDACADDTIINWMTSVRLDDAVGLARRVEPQRRTALHARLPQRRRRELDRALSFRDGTAGALADLDFAWVHHGATVSDAVETLRSHGSGDSAPLLVLDDSDRLVGALDAEQALIRGPEAPVRDCLARVRPLLASADLRAATAAFAAHGERWLPVVDESHRPMGLLSLSQFTRSSLETRSRNQEAFASLAGVMFELLTDLPKLLLGDPRAR